MDQQVGSGSLCFAKAPFIIGTASVVGTKEGEGPLADAFDCIGPDDKFGQQTWEAAESSLQKEALTLALGKADQKPEDMRYLFAGDLLGQLIASSFGKRLIDPHKSKDGPKADQKNHDTSRKHFCFFHQDL